jgi:glycosyltransferase involved in cell wall biosynthesis
MACSTSSAIKSFAERQNLMIRICHLSSVHRGLDIRIFHKECISLSAAGYKVYLVIAADPHEVSAANEVGVKIYPLKMPIGRFSRIVLHAWRTYQVGRKLNADIYHFHDPELMPYAILLSIAGKKVIYDVHEDGPQDVLTKEWIPFAIRSVVSKTIGLFEHFCAKYFFYISAATPFIAHRFRKINSSTIDINNYPKSYEFNNQPQWSEKRNEICYVGGIGRIRGIKEIVQAMSQTQTYVQLNLCGCFSEPELENACKKLPGWQKINALGFLDRRGICDVLERSIAGLVTLHPTINYLDSLPVKMFEYMAAGIPVIASDFPLWREIIAGSDCGLLVDPLNPQAIADAIDYLALNPKEAERLGKNGRKAVLEKYNWSNEEKKLLTFYESILNKSSNSIDS